MCTPTAELRSTEDLKVILINNEGRLTRTIALAWFEQFGKVRECKLIHGNKIACGMFTTEEDAEEALKQRYIKLAGVHGALDGIHCDVSTFKSGHRKIYISPVTLPDKVIRSYFESNYGCILRYESLPRHSAVFILFLKVDSAVACRNKHHYINGINVFARPGCLPGTRFQADSSTMYRVTPRLVASNDNGFSSVHNIKSSKIPSYCQESDSPLQSPLRIDSSSFQTELVPSSSILLQELKDLSIGEIDGKRRRKKKVVDNEESILKWRSTHVESNEGTIQKIGIVDNEQWERWETIRKSLNLPPIDFGAHYSRDKEGFPMHHNRKYIRSILRDGRFRFKVVKHVSFNTTNNTVKVFERAAEEYNFFGPRNPPKVNNRLIPSDEDDIGGWEDESEMNSSPSKDTEAFPHHLKWPFDFPAKPRHYPLMDSSTYEDNLSLDTNLAVAIKYRNALDEKWNNTKQHKFLSTFAPFLRAYCSVCGVKLDEPKMQFEHIFSQAHLVKLNRNKVKYSPSDFTFWNNVLIYNSEIVKRKSRGRGRTSR